MDQQNPTSTPEGTEEPLTWQIALSLAAIVCTFMLCVTAILVALIIF